MPPPCRLNGWFRRHTLFASVGLACALAPGASGSNPPASFLQTYCFECHGNAKAKADLNLERLAAGFSLAHHADEWERVSEMIETAEMPPAEAEHQPAAAERRTAAGTLRDALKTYAAEHAGEPGQVTVRRLTTAELAYVVRDLTGVEIKLDLDASSDSVGGEGFTNFGDVQFVQDATIERFLEAAKRVADHAMIGAGPLHFAADSGKTGLEIAALNRINELYAQKGFRVVSGEGGRPFGLERYGQAFFVAWSFRHRAALGAGDATLRELAAREGITGRFAEHVWSVVNRPSLGYPSREMVERWQALPAPVTDPTVAMAQTRAACEELSKYLTTWPSWFFGRGDLAAGGAGDESPLRFDDASLRVVPSHRYAHTLGGFRGFGFGRGPAAPDVAPTQAVKVVLNFNNINPLPGVKPVVIWRNARIVTRALPTRGSGRGAPPAIDPNATADANATAVGRGRGFAGPVLSTQPLREVVSAEVAAQLAFGRSSEGAALGPDDFATTATVAFEVPAPKTGQIAQLEVDAELGADRNAVIRVLVSDREGVPPRGAQARVFLGDPASEGYRAFRAGIAEYVSLLPPNSHGEANPADKDPVPVPFDNTYNSPEHDAFVLKVKYQRHDAFFTENLVDGADRERLNTAWHDLLGSWPYHDAYLGMLAEHYGVTLKSRRVQDLDAAALAALPEQMREHVAVLRANFDAVTQAFGRAESRHVDDALEFASRAWRRPLAGEEAGRLRSFYRRLRGQGAEHDDAIRAVIARTLVAPEFLYRVEPALIAERPLNGWELAARLSFFLWSSVPDEELRRAAAVGELADPARLAQQVKRMTADPKARRLATEFFGQWLGFYQFDEFRGVDTTHFPEFTAEVKQAMHREAVATFEYLVREVRPVREMLHADFAFLNPVLAKFYGVTRDLPAGEELTKINGASSFNRGGVLRLGAILTATSAPLRTSPVKRGDWVLRRILGTPTPPPPADAGSLPSDPKAFGGLSLRQKLAEHKRDPSCANCHVRIDPLGFPLEAFDAVGRWRQTYEDGIAVDVTGELADKSTVVGVGGLLQFLETKERLVMRTLARKMIGYALGRPVVGSDRALVDEIERAGGSATFADVATKIALSRQFRHRAGHDGTADPARPSQ